SSRPKRSGAARDWDCQSPTASSASTTGRFNATAPSARARDSFCRCRFGRRRAGAARVSRTCFFMATGSKGSILVIDDEEIMREILETLLTRSGYEVRLASSGQEGLDLARALPFDAAVVDIMMPGLNGIETLDELKRIDEDLAVIIITAYASVESAIAAMKS